ncbi:flavin reductase family protein [Martelella sp. HB161492]|uniref:flavin reductase family protein n=1 Tax=Martelella sp. HB161492 TaxID=2720726 RepID=UPI0015919228|nr:flavin reductase family protein [Martelella sp. HB161492]
MPDLSHVSQPDLRRALGQFATGIAVVTARHEGRSVGMTISSFTSLSMEPPLVLWSLRDNARSRAVFEAAQGFAISVLSESQSGIAAHFARGHADPFADVETIAAASGLPLIAGALAHFDCRTDRIYDGGDHRILIGRVSALSVDEGRPLVFFASRFSHGVVPMEVASHA